MIRALLLDAAGTLIELAEPVGSTYARILRGHGIDLAPADLEQGFRRAFATLPEPDFTATPEGDAAERAWWRQLVNAAAGQTIAAEAFDALFRHYARPEAWRVFPDVPQVLESAHAAGLKLAVVSNFDLRLHGILSGLGLASSFDAIISSADARARKPAAAIFHHALDRLGVAPKEALHAGDSVPLDFEAATAAGLRAVHIDRPRTTLRVLLPHLPTAPRS